MASAAGANWPGDERKVLPVEKRHELDDHVRQSAGTHTAFAEHRLLIAPVRLQLPDGDGSFVRVNTPNLQVATALIGRDFDVDVIVPGRGRPDFYDKRQRLREDGQHAWTSGQFLAEGSRHDHNVRNVDSIR